MDQNIVDLRQIEKGLHLYETVRLNDFTIIPDGADLGVKPPATIHPDQLEIIMKLLKTNKQDLVTLTADLPGIRAMLTSTQERMIHAHEWLMDHLDLWDRLEKLYREIVPQDTECIHAPETFCSEGAVVNCKACEGRHYGKQLT